MTQKIISKSLKETKKIAFRLASQIKKGDIILLYGDLGSGKTTFCKYICEFFNIFDVNSPTFTLLNIYENNNTKIFHFDLYRIKDEKELYDIDYEDYFYNDGITIVEWADRLNQLLPEKGIKIFLKYIDKNSREIIIN
ncbi:MAG TPA: tRNA (adenosine(37)-N6)-threonylcarbamoyltransferase complex ATPase subunit type 1 TsaE [bacterium]|nr:tRNA (adenosine(37)-N6)-threonylcarbamoyltransferase complex ATPase subunit type 1 TsaE [bacterium]HOL46863.1 tRNA (adenosine(37)-N6)-threonylcarbamoyltransferase complex ATPase subunit type 1 TsaE [bacterium]HPQ18788.1 tRNA (adenosine(37)-N6)-threonylcarbamoyltransferase complex ATPase subunit type 1 TsaE [bacterium]